VTAAESACGPREVRFEVKADQSQHPTPVPQNGKALLYVVQEDGISSRFGVDGKWLGADKGRTYFVVPIDPGDRHVCVIGRIGVLTRVYLRQLNAEPGVSYYLVPEFIRGAFGPKFTVNLVDADEGRYLVARAKFSVSRPK
jgi:hypothetical protein